MPVAWTRLIVDSKFSFVSIGRQATYADSVAMFSQAIGDIHHNWLVYRRIRQRFEANKVYVIALRVLMATVFLPGSPSAFPDLPTHLTQVQSVSYAINRACNPQDIVSFLMQSPPTSAVMAVWEWGAHRGDVCEQILVATAEMSVDFLPLHDVACIAVESAKVLMEMDAGILVMKRTGRAKDRRFRISSWFYPMKLVSQVLRSVGQVPSDEEEGESIQMGCSNLIGSMVRMADEWAKSVAAEETMASSQPEQESGPPNSTTDSPHVNGYTTQTHTFDPNRQSVPAHHQQYMDSSDRWMASNHESHPFYIQQSAGFQNTYPPTAVDLLLSQMFNYSYQPSQTNTQPVNDMEHTQSWEPPGAVLDQNVHEMPVGLYQGQSM